MRDFFKSQKGDFLNLPMQAPSPFLTLAGNVSGRFDRGKATRKKLKAMFLKFKNKLSRMCTWPEAFKRSVG